jgi:hypothetical protein
MEGDDSLLLPLDNITAMPDCGVLAKVYHIISDPTGPKAADAILIGNKVSDGTTDLIKN